MNSRGPVASWPAGRAPDRPGADPGGKLMRSGTASALGLTSLADTVASCRRLRRSPGTAADCTGTRGIARRRRPPRPAPQHLVAVAEGMARRFRRTGMGR
jgi:hypothetical protein